MIPSCNKPQQKCNPQCQTDNSGLQQSAAVFTLDHQRCVQATGANSGRQDEDGRYHNHHNEMSAHRAEKDPKHGGEIMPAINRTWCDRRR